MNQNSFTSKQASARSRTISARVAAVTILMSLGLNGAFGYGMD